MYFDLDEDKRLFEDIQFKRQVAFVDDDDVLKIDIASFSTSTEKPYCNDRSCQVNIQNEITSSAAQTRPKKHKEVQTESKEDEVSGKSDDLNRVNRLLQKRGNLIEEAIRENNETSAFLNYDVDWLGGGNSITNPFTLTYQQLIKDEELQVTGLEWNSAGTTIFVGYGRYDHETVCTHKSALCSWNIDRLRINCNKPDMSIETSFCISALATHPEYPSIIACGFFNGEIHVYNMREEEPLAATITDKKEMHLDEITALKWIKDSKTSKKKYLLMSGSKDGKILIWNPLPTKAQLKLVDGFRMLVDFLPKNTYRALGAEMGVSSISINNEDKETFLVGCDSGGLFKCSINSELLAKPKWEDDFPIDLKNPVSLAFDAEYGPIYSISSSPFHRNLILTCGTDTVIRLYSLLQTSNLANFCPENGYLYSVRWSPSRPCVFACGSHQGTVLIYDLMQSGNDMCQVIQASDKPVHLVSFNQQRAGYLCSGDRAGVVKVWRLSQDLTNLEPDEMKKLNDISEKPFAKN